MSAQRTRPSEAADHRSAHPDIPGVPWWGAVLIAVVASALGFAIDAGSGDGELTSVFAALFGIGCVAAVLAVRQSGLFTAVIQPPLILFVVVPGAYFLMHSDAIDGLKDILINCGYPLIERFPLMFFTSAAVLLIGLARWYFGAVTRQAGTDAAEARAARTPAAKPGRLSAMVASLIGGRTAARTADAKAAAADSGSPRRREADRRRAAAKRSADRPARGDTPGRRTKPAPRRPRRDETEIIEPVAADRPRRRRPRPEDAPPEPRRRTRNAANRDPRRAAPVDDRRTPYDRERAPRPPQRRSRYEGYEGYQTFGGYDRYEPPRDAPRDPGGGTHHPVSRVRYRGGEEADDRVEYRSRRRPPRENDADRWEYDI